MAAFRRNHCPPCLGIAGRFASEYALKDNLLPFSWDIRAPARELNRQQKEFLKEAGDFNILCGFTVPIHDSHGRIAALTLASEQPELRFKSMVESCRHILHLMAIHFHANVRLKLQRSNHGSYCSLTPREIECLQWAAQGKSRVDTAVILGVSEWTVRFHLANAKCKLKVATIKQAIALGVRMDIIRI